MRLLRDKCTLLLRKALEQNVQQAHVMSMRQGDEEFYRKLTAQTEMHPAQRVAVALGTE